MAKDKNQNPGKAKVRIFYAEVEGGDETIKDGLKSIANAMIRAVQPQVVVRALPPVFPPPEEQHFDETINGELPQEEEALGEEGVAASRPARPRKQLSYTLLGDLNLRPDGQQSLKAFVAECKARNQQECYLVIAYYLKKKLNVAKVTEDHIYTGFKEIEKKSPLDIPQIGRNIQSRKGWLTVSELKGVEVTVTGENYVEHDMGVAEEEPVEA